MGNPLGMPVRDHGKGMGIGETQFSRNMGSIGSIMRRNQNHLRGLGLSEHQKRSAISSHPGLGVEQEIGVRLRSPLVSPLILDSADLKIHLVGSRANLSGGFRRNPVNGTLLKSR